MNTPARLTLAVGIALCGSGAALATENCGMNTNKPCPPPEKLIIKEPAVRQTGAASVPMDVQAEEAGDAEARATLSGVSASDLKMPPPKPCSLNSNKPCSEQGKEAATASDVTVETEPANPRRKKPVE